MGYQGEMTSKICNLLIKKTSVDFHYNKKLSPLDEMQFLQVLKEGLDFSSNHNLNNFIRAWHELTFSQPLV